jgi:hypothetical protein
VIDWANTHTHTYVRKCVCIEILSQLDPKNSEPSGATWWTGRDLNPGARAVGASNMLSCERLMIRNDKSCLSKIVSQGISVDIDNAYCA